MKRLIVLVVCLKACATTLGQGLIDLRTRVSALGINAPVTEEDWWKLDGAEGWLAQAYLSEEAGQPFRPVGEVMSFRTGRAIGYIDAIVLDTGLPIGTDVWVQLAAWNIKDGASYEEAQEANGAVGKSDPIRVKTGGPDAPANLVGLQPWRVQAPVVLPDILKGWQYTWDAQGLTIVAFNDSASEVTIPETLDGHPVIGIGSGALACHDMTKVMIGSGITTIGGSAFENCYRLVEFQVSSANPNYCSLNGVLFNKDQTRIVAYPAGRSGVYAIPEGVLSIGAGAFSGCNNLAGITIPNTVTRIEEGAFQYCSSLTNVIIPNGVHSIGSSAFVGCRRLTSVDLPEGLTSIATDTFLFCSGLTNVTIPRKVTQIESRAFGECERLTEVALPSNVTRIGNWAFWKCKGLTNVTIPRKVTHIGSRAFGGCERLTEVAIPAHVTRIGAGAFLKCKRLMNVTIPEGLTRIEDEVFAYCTGLTSVRIPDRVTALGRYAFDGCSGLTSVVLGNSVTNVEAGAFRHCRNLTRVLFAGNAPHFNSSRSPFWGANAAVLYHRPGTSGWSETVEGRPTGLWVPLSLGEPLDPLAAPLRLLAPLPTASDLIIQRSSNLRDWEDWRTVSRDKGPGEVNDPDAATVPYRFYRVVGE